MSAYDYIKDKILMILFWIACLFLLNITLVLLGNPIDVVLLVWIVWIIVLIISLVVDYSKRKKHFQDIYQLLEQLDKRYLLAEVMKPGHRLEDRLYQDIIRKSNKSVIEQINLLEDERREYKEYIESWIHEVKLPITSMELICENNKNEVTKRISSECRRIENYVEMALFYARSDTVYQDYMICELDLEKIVMETISHNKQYFIMNQISIEINLEEKVVYSDEKWIGFILIQVLLNCVKYKGKDSGQIEITSYNVKNGVCLCVKDNGIGIKQSELKRIFDKGFTGSNGRNTVKSTGIGLYLCRKLCNKLGLLIDVESSTGDEMNQDSFTKLLIIFPKGSYLSKL